MNLSDKLSALEESPSYEDRKARRMKIVSEY